MISNAWQKKKYFERLVTREKLTIQHYNDFFKHINTSNKSRTHRNLKQCMIFYHRKQVKNKLSWKTLQKYYTMTEKYTELGESGNSSIRLIIVGFQNIK